MAAFPYKGATFYADYMGSPHLVIVMNDPDKDGLCLLLFVTTVYPDKKHDPACILTRGDHPFLDRQSYIVYARADYARGQHLANLVAKGLYAQRDDLEPSIMARVADGIYKSDNSRPSLIKYAERNGI